MEGTQGGKRKEQVEEPFHELEAFKFVSLRWSLFFSTQTTTGSSFESKSRKGQVTSQKRAHREYVLKREREGISCDCRPGKQI